MSAWWITFEDGTQGCVETEADELPEWPRSASRLDDQQRKELFENYHREVDTRVLAIATEHAGHGKALKKEQLPYPADPRLRVVGIGSQWGPCPSFCWRPQECAGRGSCPRPISCTE